MRYEYLTTTDEGVKIYAGIDSNDLIRVTCTEDDPDYLAWLEDENK